MTGQRITELDGLRGLAIGLVLALHMIIRPNAWLWDRLLGTEVAMFIDMAWCGVDIFFVLSGFLIGGIILDKRSSPNFYKAFYARRATRIFPAYFLLVGIAFLPLGTLGVHADSGDVPFVAYATFTANLFTAAGLQFSYWLGPLWSICIEEQFYIVAPFLLRFVPFSATPWIIACIVLASAGLRSAWALGLVAHSISYWDFTLTRLDGLGVGVLAAWLVRNEPLMQIARRRRRHVKLALAGLFTVCAWFSQQTNDLLLGPGIFFLSLAAGVAIVLMRLEPQGKLAELFRAWPLVSLGKYSYFMYLFHMPVFWFCQTFLYRYDQTAPFVTAISLALVTALAVASWRCLESPFLRLGRRVRY